MVQSRENQKHFRSFFFQYLHSSESKRRRIGIFYGKSNFSSSLFSMYITPTMETELLEKILQLLPQNLRTYNAINLLKVECF